MAPPPRIAELPFRVQPNRVHPSTPPPFVAELPVRVQLVSAAFAEAHHTPPPLPSLAYPLVSVNPVRLAPLVREAHRFVPPPSMTVYCGPLTLVSVSGLVTA